MKEGFCLCGLICWRAQLISVLFNLKWAPVENKPRTTKDEHFIMYYYTRYCLTDSFFDFMSLCWRVVACCLKALVLYKWTSNSFSFSKWFKGILNINICQTSSILCTCFQILTYGKSIYFGCAHKARPDLTAGLTLGTCTSISPKLYCYRYLAVWAVMWLFCCVLFNEWVFFFLSLIYFNGCSQLLSMSEPRKLWHKRDVKREKWKRKGS